MLWRRWPVAAFAAALTSVIAGGYFLSPRPQPGGGEGGVAVAAIDLETPALSEQDAQPRDRQIRFMTHGGTRVIWTLKPTAAKPSATTPR